MKKIFKFFIITLLFLIILVIILVSAFFIHNKMAFVKRQKEENKFVSEATAYLESKYDIDILKCSYYKAKRVEYHQPMIDGGYFYSTPEFGVFETTTGTEIYCVNKDGIFSDDYKLDELYSTIYEYLSKEIELPVSYINIDAYSSETYTENENEYLVEKNIGMYLEKDTQHYNDENINQFMDALYNYLEDFNFILHVENYTELSNTDLEKICKNLNSYRTEHKIKELTLFIYAEPIKTSRQSLLQLQGTIDDGEIYRINLENNYNSQSYSIYCSDKQKNENNCNVIKHEIQ